MKIAIALFRSSLLAAVAVTGSACVGYPVYSDPVDTVYYPSEYPVYYPQTTYYPYPVYQSRDPSYVLWYNNDHHHSGYRGGHHDRGHGRGHDRDHGYDGRDRGNGYDQVRRDLCRERGGCERRDDDRGGWNDREDRDDRNDNRNRKPPPVAFTPRPQGNVVAPRAPRDPGRSSSPRPQQIEQTRTPYAKPARIVEVQNPVKVTAPPPRQERQNRRNDDDSTRKTSDRDRKLRAQ